jgi:hypothetical protein
MVSIFHRSQTNPGMNFPLLSHVPKDPPVIIILDITTVMTPDKQHKSRSSSLCSFAPSPVTSSRLGQNRGIYRTHCLVFVGEEHGKVTTLL